MKNSPQSRFVYVIYIRATAERLWAALTTPEFMYQYWLGFRTEAEWKVGGAWKRFFPDGRTADSGEITEFEPLKRLGIRWRHESSPELKAEGWSLCTMDIELSEGAAKLTLTHSIERDKSKLISAVSGGWPQILSNLKSLLETGATLLPPRTPRG